MLLPRLIKLKGRIAKAELCLLGAINENEIKINQNTYNCSRHRVLSFRSF